MYCYSLVREIFDFLHGDWGDLNLNYLRVGINDIFAVQQVWSNFFAVEKEDVPRCQFHISFKVDQSFARKTRLVNNGDINNSTYRKDKWLKKIQSPPIAELIFTKDDIWSASRLPQTALQVYSENGIDHNVSGKHKDHCNNWESYSVISFSPRSRTKSPQAYGDVQPISKDIAARRSLAWQERSKRYLVIKSNCKCCHPSSIRSYFSILSLAKDQGKTKTLI